MITANYIVEQLDLPLVGDILSSSVVRKRIVGGFTICVENWRTYIDAHKVYGELMFSEAASDEDEVDEFFDNGLL